jgi:hypothetical protein
MQYYYDCKQLQFAALSRTTHLPDHHTLWDDVQQRVTVATNGRATLCSLSASGVATISNPFFYNR